MYGSERDKAMRPIGKTGNYISTRIGRAIADYKMIEDGDRILVAVSGGKDSLAMLKLLNERKKWAPINYELIAMHVETDYKCASICSKRLKGFFEKEGVSYRFKKIKIAGKDKKESCFWCSWNRRKALFDAAAKLGCKKIAMGHHKDDIIETLLLNIFFQGEFSGMNPRQELFDGKLTIIRPLCYVEEESTRKYAKEAKLPVQQEACPNSAISQRRVMKDFIKKVEKDCEHVRTNIFRSISRVNREYTKVV